MDLFLPNEVAEMTAAACRTARYDEYLALLESAMEDYEELSDQAIRLEGREQYRAEIRRDVARERASLYAGVAAAYRPAVDPVALAREIKAALASAEGGESR